MDNQPTKDLSFADAIAKIKEIATDANICMMHTDLQNFPDNCRPMALQEADDEGNLWFISSDQSQQNADINKNPQIMVTFQNSSKMEYLVAYGKASIHKDQEKIDEYWTNFANAWFEGKDDPRITIIRVKVNKGHYWDTKDGKLISSAKMIFSAITGSDVDDGGVSGELNV